MKIRIWVIAMDVKSIRFGALFGIITSILLILLGFFITPDYVAQNLSYDGILEPTTINDINKIRLAAVVASILILMFNILPDLLLKIYRKNYILWGAIFLLFAILIPSVGHKHDINVFSY